jgi:hypothetical protein
MFILQVLNRFFGDYVRENNFAKLVLIGHNGQQKECTLQTHMTLHNKIATKIISGWSEFCTDNDFNINDQLRFKFADMEGSSKVYVFKKSFQY